MVVKTMDLASLVPYKGNPRKRPKEAVDAVAASLKVFGWQQPIVVDSKNVIVVGHTRYAAALKLGLTSALVTVISDSQSAAYRLIDNRSGEFTTWDDELLPAELDALPSLDGFDLEAFDFDAQRVDSVAGAESAGEPGAGRESGQESAFGVVSRHSGAPLGAIPGLE